MLFYGEPKINPIHKKNEMESHFSQHKWVGSFQFGHMFPTLGLPTLVNLFTKIIGTRNRWFEREQRPKPLCCKSLLHHVRPKVAASHEAKGCEELGGGVGSGGRAQAGFQKNKPLQSQNWPAKDLRPSHKVAAE